MANDGEEARAIIEAVLATATQELARMQQQLAQHPRLQQRARQLEQFIALGKLLTDPAPALEIQVTASPVVPLRPCVSSGVRAHPATLDVGFLPFLYPIRVQGAMVASQETQRGSDHDPR